MKEKLKEIITKWQAKVDEISAELATNTDSHECLVLIASKEGVQKLLNDLKPLLNEENGN